MSRGVFVLVVGLALLLTAFFSVASIIVRFS